MKLWEKLLYENSIIALLEGTAGIVRGNNIFTPLSAFVQVEHLNSFYVHITGEYEELSIRM